METKKKKGKKLVKVLKIVLVFVLVLAIGTAGFLTWFVRRPWPKTAGSIEVNGTMGEITVIRDEYGIPNIYAENDYDLFYAQGYVTAQDRLFQMEMHRRIGGGTLSEIAGAAGLVTDKQSRYYGFRHIAEKSLAMVDDETMELIQAYCDGVNEYIDTHSNKLPLEFSILGFKPEHWEPLDVLSFCNYMAQINAYNINYELYFTQAVAKMGMEMAVDELPPWDDDNPEIITEELEEYSWKQTVTKETPVRDIPALLKQNYESGNNDWLKDANITGLTEADGVAAYFQQFKWASGTWAVSGEHTESGEPILACDAHMYLTIPSFWYEVGLHGGSFDVSGYSLPGAPFVLLGRNADISWGFVNLNPDVMDLYVETLDDMENPQQYLHKGEWHDLETRTEVINVKGSDPIVFEIKSTNHGPILNDWLAITPEEEKIVEEQKESRTVPILANSKWESEQPLALRWAVQDGCNILGAVSKLNRAGNWEEFRDALSTWDSLGESFIYADKEGNIGYQAAAKVPIRKDGHLGICPVSGSSGEYEWDGFIPFEELPSLYNPPTGYVASINNKTTTDNYPYLLTYDWFHPGYRARSVVTQLDEMIESGKKITVEDMRTLQEDGYSYAADQIKDYISIVEPENDLERKVLEYIQSWDGCFDKDSVGATIYNTWYTYMQTNTYYAGAAGYEAWGFQFPLKHIESMVDIIKEPDNKWFDDVQTTDVVESRDDQIKKSFKQAVEHLKKEYGSNPEKWTIENLQTATLQHPLFAGIPFVGALFESKTVPFAGSPTSVAFAFCNTNPPDKFNVSFASTQRHIMSYDDPDYMQAVLSTGESAHLYHEHRQDQMELWADVQYYRMPFGRAAVEAAAEDTLTLIPTGN